MNDVNEAYMQIVQESNHAIHESHAYKPYLKKLILENISDIDVIRPPDKTKPEQIILTKQKDTLVSSAVTSDHLKDDVKILLKAAKILRRDIENSTPWKFIGSFSDYKTPALVNIFSKHVVQGSGGLKYTTREGFVSRSASVLTQHIVQAYKSDRQVSYNPKSNHIFRHNIETPLNVGLALDIHKSTRCKTVIEKLADLDLAIAYDKLLEIEMSIANSVLKQSECNGGVCLPSWLVKESFVWFSLDNIDFLENTPCGKDTLHGTAVAIFQEASSDKAPIISSVELSRTGHRENLEHSVSYDIMTCKKPQPKNVKYNCQLQTATPVSDLYKKTDMIWVIGCLDFQDHKETQVHNNAPGTWGAFNSLLLADNANNRTNVALTTPLIRSPPTEYGTLLTGLMRAHNITKMVMGSDDAITVITLDMQLYDMAMKLWMTNENIRKKFLFRPGELHIMFWALACLGDYIEGSGIDQAWLETGIYSPATVNQILKGKHLYRSLEAHIITVIALYSMYFNHFVKSQYEEREFLIESSTKVREAYQRSVSKIDSGNYLCEAVKNATAILDERDMWNKCAKFKETASPLQKFILNYMKQVETVLLFLRSTRQCNLLLHMESVEGLVKYFFAHDHLNYARLIPLYISSMQETETSHPLIWEEFLKGKFCVTKGLAGFTSIAPDHAIEHENRRLKVIGGIVGITQNQEALDRFFLIAPEISNILDGFAQEFSIDNKYSRKQHHELTGRKLSRIMKNATCLKGVFLNHVDPFTEDSSELYNLLTRQVLTEDVTSDIVKRDDIGQQMFEEFVDERLVQGNLSVWAPMKRRKLKTFKAGNARLNITTKGKLVHLKEERGLLQRFIVIARNRPHLDLKECLGNYEFGVTPRSLFASDGSILLAYDKFKILHQIEELVSKNIDTQEQDDIMEESTTTDTETEPQHDQCASTSDVVAPEAEDHSRQPSYHVLLIDGMALVNSLNKTPLMKTWENFAQSVLDKLCIMVMDYNEVRIVFDRYIETSLKTQTRKKRTKGKSTYYHVSEKSIIQHIPMKELLANPKTKDELCQYLGRKIVHHSQSSHNRLKKCIVTFGKESDGNFDIPNTLLTHSQEEADTLLLLHALTIDREAEVVIDSPDTDVFLLMIHMYPRLPMATSFLTGKGSQRRKVNVQAAYNTLGSKRASAILGFHAFTGSDMCGRFSGRSKDWCFKIFMKCDHKILESFESLGVDEPSPEIFSNLERFVCKLYRGDSYTKVNELRWFLFSNRGAMEESLPPTTGALIPHIRRAHYIAMIWKMADKSHPCLPSPDTYGWEFDNKCYQFVAVRCLNLPAPEAVLLLIKCQCKTGCKKSCSCRKNKIPCTELCQCFASNCSNKFISEEEKLANEMDEGNEFF